ncbi:High-affnity carbon uptake protein Hat/HatR [Fimbriiglobus ruber]|uniref:High-affnity carbon uptake protein Hat/HatR n=2 Tax=Fimbriiglobus ruber TaxID=1908690 RepID=A0A225DCA5_9BACT|nr:High-affnity carbon uptake protein Hat/HatR [Fimbriiglobus ruber]
MVFGVCRRILGHTADAEDAFQATFLVLVRRAKTLREPGRVAGWLYGVAYRIARRVRADRARRRQREQTMITESPAPPPPDDTRDLRRLLDEELDHLPEKYRLPIVLCELEGRTLDEAARELGWPKGSVAGRLSRGRDMLRQRLSRRRGLILPVFVLGGTAVPAAAETPPDSLVTATVSAAAAPATSSGQAAAAPTHADENSVARAATVGLARAHADAFIRSVAAKRGRFLLALLLAVLLFALAGWEGAVALSAAPATVDAAPAGSCHASPP